MKGILDFAKGPAIAMFLPFLFLLLAEAIYLPGLLLLVMTDDNLTLKGVSFSFLKAGSLWGQVLWLSMAFYLTLLSFVGLVIFVWRLRKSGPAVESDLGRGKS